MASEIYLLSDTHFGHENIYKFTWVAPDGVERRIREEFADAAEGDAAMIERWNKVVRPQDHVWHLGDFTLERGNGNYWKLARWLSLLNGHKRLVLGNHDHFDVRQYRDAGFQKVKGCHRIADLVLTHIPIHPSGIGPKVLANVHGHIHQNPSPPGAYVNVSVERTNYTPVHIDEVRVMARKAREVA